MIMDLSQPDPPVRPGMPFKRMYQVREEVHHVEARIRQTQGLLIIAQRTANHSHIDRLQSQLRSLSAELVSIQKKLKPLEDNFLKSQKPQKDPDRRDTPPSEPRPKRQKTDHRYEFPSGVLLNASTDVLVH
jgi:hypothetical protein